MLTAEKQRVVIDWYVRWRITDPSEYIRNVGLDENAGANQLNRVVRNAFQEDINKRTVQANCSSSKREALMADVKREVLAVVQGAKPWGVDVVDVRITRVDYVEAITESVYRRMEAERKRVANELRSTGVAEGEKIRADADRQREVTVANAYRDAQKIKGEGDAQAAAHLRRSVRPRSAVRAVLPQPGRLQGELQQEERRDGGRPVVRVLQGHARLRQQRAAPASRQVSCGRRALDSDTLWGAGPGAGDRGPAALRRRPAAGGARFSSSCSCATGSCVSSACAASSLGLVLLWLLIAEHRGIGRRLRKPGKILF